MTKHSVSSTWDLLPPAGCLLERLGLLSHTTEANKSAGLDSVSDTIQLCALRQRGWWEIWGHRTKSWRSRMEPCFFFFSCMLFFFQPHIINGAVIIIAVSFFSLCPRQLIGFTTAAVISPPCCPVRGGNSIRLRPSHHPLRPPVQPSVRPSSRRGCSAEKVGGWCRRGG